MSLVKAYSTALIMVALASLSNFTVASLSNFWQRHFGAYGALLVPCVSRSNCEFELAPSLGGRHNRGLVQGTIGNDFPAVGIQTHGFRYLWRDEFEC
jgi:hypothetical protein